LHLKPCTIDCSFTAQQFILYMADCMSFRKVVSSQIKLIKCENAIRVILQNGVEVQNAKWDTQ